MRRTIVGSACLALAVSLWALCIGGAFGLAATPHVSSPAGSQRGALSASLGGSLTIPDGEELLGGELQAAAARARRVNPEAVTARERSRTRFEHLSATQAVHVARKSFPDAVNGAAGGAPKLSAGERILKYEAGNAVAIELADGKHGVIESLGPMATPSGHGQFTPINLALHSTGNGYAPTHDNVAVQIPKRASAGVSMPGDGVSLTPVNAQGQSLGGSEGAQAGASVVYSNTQTDTDTLAKPTTGGFEIDSLLRSVDSPQILYFKVGMPAGAKLMGGKGPGGARVVLNGQTIAWIAPPSAQDATGSGVPVEMGVSGDTVGVTVKLGSGEYQYPIEVDPRAYDYTIQLPSNCNNYEGENTNWEFYSEKGGFECYSSGPSSGYGVVMSTVGWVNPEEFDELKYPAHGESQVTYIEGEMQAAANPESAAKTTIEFLYGESNAEVKYTFANPGESFGKKLDWACDQPVIEEGIEHCRAVHNANELRIAQTDTATKSVSEGYGFWFELYNGAWTSVFQEKGPKATFNTSSGTAGEWANVLYGSGGWLGSGSGAFEVVGSDPGLGVSKLTIKDVTAGATLKLTKAFSEEGHCSGVWCGAEYQWGVPYQSGMVEGNNTIETCVEDSAYMKECKTAVVKVDDAKPYGIKLKGLAETGAEISPTRHQLTVEATDGTESVPGSGIQSISVAIDGREIETSKGSCSPSPNVCAASGTWTIDGETLGAGEHKLIVAAVDKAGNTERKEFTFAVRNASPVSLGPGSVDPVTGQYRLTAGDVDISGVGSVSRTYSSRSWNAGLEGPLGPQWTLNAGAGQTLAILPNQNAELHGSGGGRTTFGYSQGKKEFVSPKGDENIKLESYEKEAGKGVTEYLLKNPAAGTTTRFILPAGAGVWVPKATEGPAPEDTTAYAYRSAPQDNEYSLPSGSAPWGIAQGPDGNLWFANVGTSKIGKITTSGGTTEYPLPSGSEPHAIAQGPDGNLWFTDWGTSKVGRITPAGVVSEYSLPAGSKPQDITAGPNGQMWFTEYSTNKIGEINPANPAETHEYSLPPYSEPHDIAPGPGDTLWFTDLGTGKVGLITISGGSVEYSMPGGSIDPHAIAEGPNGELWYTVGAYTQSVEEMKATGEVEHTYPIPAGSEPYGITLGPEGNLWFADVGTSKISKLSVTSGAITEYELPGSSGPVGITLGPDGNLWYTDEYSNKIGVMTSAGTAVEPTEILGPVPAGVSCGKNPAEGVTQSELQKALEELKAGCRALSYTYADKTTASGEGPTQWGEYIGRLSRVSFTAYNPGREIKAMETVAVAEYVYDKKGRLRAEWDPRLEHTYGCGGTCAALKTTYGYDNEGHVTAVTPPGQQPWAFTYGAIAGDPGTGRLLKVTRGQPKTGESEEEVKKRLSEEKEAPVNGEAPKITGSTVVGGTAEVSNGKWTGVVVGYSYQWEDCNGEGASCSPIAGATNANYTLQLSDLGHKLVAVVGATNGGGTVFAPSAASGAAVKAEDFTLPSGSSPEDMAAGSDGNLWFTDYETGKIGKLNSTTDAVTEYSLPSGRKPFSIAAGPDGNLWFTEPSSNKVGKITTSGTITEYEAHTSGSAPEWIAAGPDGNLWFSEYGASKIGKITPSGSITEYSLASGSGPVGIVAGPNKENAMWFVDFSSGKIGKITTSGSVTEYAGSTGSEPFGIAVGSDGNLWFTEYGASKLGRVTTAGSATEYTLPAESHPIGIAAGPEGEAGLWFTDEGTSMLGKMTTAGAISEYALPSNSHPRSLAQGPNGSMWIPERTSAKITKFVAAGPGQYGAYPQPGSTIEYHVPVSGSGAPYQMTSSDMAKWGQTKDLPEEATAVFPQDEPQGWPASDYKRATVMYMDTQARTTNALAPSGAMSTVEYNSLNELTRSLSANDRAIAMKETCESETKCKSAEVAQNLSSDKIYNTEGTQLLETFGPEHKIRLANGEEEETRDRQTFSYNEGAPSNGELHNLVTKSKRWSETASKKELAVQVAHDYYSGQNNLGWKLRKPTQTVAEAGGHTTTTTSQYQPETGAPLETFSGQGSGGPGPVFDDSFGSDPGGHGKFNWPKGMTIDSKGNIWIVDTYNERVQEFSSSGQYIRQFGEWGSGNGQMEEPTDIATDIAGHVWVVDPGDERVQEFSEAGEYIGQFGSEGTGNGQFKKPEGIAADSKGNIWVVDTGNNRVQEFNSKLEYVAQFGARGSESEQFLSPNRITVDGKGNIWVTDGKNCRVEEFNEKREFVRAFGSYGSGNGQLNAPQGIRVDKGGHVWVADENNDRIEEFSETGAYLSQFGEYGTGNGQLWEEEGLALDKEGNVWVLDTGNARLQEFSDSGTYIKQFGSKGGPEQKMDAPKGVAVDPSGNVWVADTYNDRIDEYSSAGEFIAKYGSEGTGNGQFKFPRAIAVDSKGSVWVADQNNNRVEELNSKGEYVRQFGSWGTESGQFKEPQGVTIDSKGNVWVADTVNNRIEEFSETGAFIMQFGSVGSGNGQLSEPRSVAVEPSGYIWVSDSNNNRLEEFNSKGEYVTKIGEWGSKEGQFEWPLGITLDQHGTLWVADANNGRIQEFTSTGTLIGTLGTPGSGNGQMNEPRAIAVDPQGNAWVADTNNNRIERWTVATPADTQTIYYTAAANASAPTCGEHPEWADLVCQTEHLAQPGNTVAPPLPIVTTTYNMWDEPETVVEKIGSVTRTTTRTYDYAGRQLSNGETSTSSEDKEIPGVSTEYNAETGALVERRQRVALKFQTIKSVYNTLGQLSSYTDAAGATTTYTYDVDGRVEELVEPEGRQIYSYDPTTGFMTKLWDSAAKTFSATYGVSGEMLTESYPNGMTATYTYDTIGQATNLQYEKTTHCSETCVLFSDADTYGAGGEQMTQTSSLAKEEYAYSEMGQLTQTKETPVGGKGCVTRNYAYNEEGERSSITTREPNEKGDCTSEGGVIEENSYDSGGRLVDPGVTYDVLGNMTKVPALDAGGQAIASTFYVDNQVHTQEQGAKRIEYAYDPVGRTLTATSKQEAETTKATSHYAGPGVVTWTCEEAGGCKEEGESKWTRNIPGIDGSLGAIETHGGTPELQLHDLQGNIVATIADNELEATLLSTHNSSDFGVSAGNKAPKYGWLGALGASSELGTGVITEAGATYVPQLAQSLQTEELVPPGAESDCLGCEIDYIPPELSWSIQAGQRASGEIVTEQRTLEMEAQMAEQGEGVDPIKWYGAWEAQTVGEKLKGLKTLGEIADWVDVGFSVPVEVVEGLLVKHFTWSKLSSWLDRAGTLLEECSWNIRSGGKFNISTMECKFEDWNFEIKIFGVHIVTLPIVNFFKPAKVYQCIKNVRCYLLK